MRRLDLANARNQLGEAHAVVTGFFVDSCASVTYRVRRPPFHFSFQTDEPVRRGAAALPANIPSWSVHGDLGGGFVVLDAVGHPVSANTEAVQILMYPDLHARQTTSAVARRIRTVLIEPRRDDEPLIARIAQSFVSGKRQYFCRVFALDAFGPQVDGSRVGVVFERGASSAARLSQIATEFGLTPRERQALAFLGQGLSSRDIAGRMQISPNTVKAFLRVIMIKMGVSSRSSILGKVLARASDPAAPPRRFVATDLPRSK